jgi:hypothetical protein
MPVLTEPRDDLLHAPEADPFWGESFFFYWYSADHGLCMMCAVRVRPNQREADWNAFVLQADGTTASLVETRPHDPDGALAMPGLRFVREEPMRTWRVVMENLRLETESLGVVVLDGDLRYTALMPPVGTDGRRPPVDAGAASGAARRTFGAGHLDQAGSWGGRLAIGDRIFSLLPERTLGGRDRSWGPRRWHAPESWRWMAINLGEDMHVGGFCTRIDGRELHRGWVWRGGEAVSVRAWEFDTRFAADGTTPIECVVRCTDKRDRVFVITGEVLGLFPMRPTSNTVIQTAVVRWRFEDRIGHGLTDYMHRHGDLDDAVAANERFGGTAGSR